MPILELIYVVCALAHENVVAAIGKSPPSWRELRTTSLFTTSPPNALSLRLGEHRLNIRGGEGEGLVWPA